MGKVNKAALAQLIADEAGVSKKEAEDMLAAFVQVVIKNLRRGEDVTIAGFGAFSAKVRAGRIGVNPQNPSEKIQIPPVTVPKFKAGKALKDALKSKTNEHSMKEPEAREEEPVDMFDAHDAGM